MLRIALHDAPDQLGLKLRAAQDVDWGEHASVKNRQPVSCQLVGDFTTFDIFLLGLGKVWHAVSYYSACGRQAPWGVA